MPASAPEIANAAMITRLAEMPISRVTAKSWLAASMPRPCTERRRKSVSTTSESRQVTVVMTGSQPIEYVPPKRSASLNTFGIGTPFWRGETNARKRFWMITLIAKLENSSVTKLAPRSGRNAMRSISTRRDRRREHAPRRPGSGTARRAR